MVVVLISNCQGTQGCFTSWLHPRLLCHSGKLEKRVWCILKRLTRNCPQKWKRKKVRKTRLIYQKRLKRAYRKSMICERDWIDTMPVSGCQPLVVSVHLSLLGDMRSKSLSIPKTIIHFNCPIMKPWALIWTNGTIYFFLQPYLKGGHPRHGPSCLPSRTRPSQEG